MPQKAAAIWARVMVSRGMPRISLMPRPSSNSFLISARVALNLGSGKSAAQNAARGAAVGLIVDVLLSGVAPLYGIAGGRIFTALGAQLGASQYSPAFEAEADYVALYMMAQADFKLPAAPNLWRRLAAVNPQAAEDQPLASHPTAPARFVLLDRIVREIREKQKRGEALVPNSPKQKPETKE